MTARNMPSCGEVGHGTEAYAAEVALRDAVLRKPLGLTFDPADLARESDSFHLACWAEGEMVGCVVLKPINVRQVQLRQMAVAQRTKERGSERGW